MVDGPAGNPPVTYQQVFIILIMMAVKLWLSWVLNLMVIDGAAH